MERRTATTYTIWSSWVVALVCALAWPATSVTVFRGEPQGILGLSWVAIIYTAANTLVTAYTKREADTAADAVPAREAGA